MTIQEAIRMQESIKRFHRYDEEVESSCDMAISALEKQIPKKPIKGEDGDLSCSCGLIIQRKNRRTCLYYCHNCGQAIDWSDED